MNAVVVLKREHTFQNLNHFEIDDEKYDFEAWVDCKFNKTMSKDDLMLYNYHMLKIYSDDFLNDAKLTDLLNYRKYLRNIRNSFIETKSQICDIGYEEKLNEIIHKIHSGSKFLECLIQLKDGKLCTYAYPLKKLKDDIDLVMNKSENNDFVLSFRNKTLSYYYDQKLIRSTFVLNRASNSYFSFKSNLTVKITFMMPVHLDEYDESSTCIELRNLPDFFKIE